MAVKNRWRTTGGRTRGWWLAAALAAGGVAVVSPVASRAPALADVSVSGVVNTYQQVAAISGATVTLTGAPRGAAASFAVGDHVMLVQMTGSAPVVAGSSMGNYDVSTVVAVSGSTVTLDGVSRTYSPATERVQLVRGVFDPGTVTVSSAIGAAPWDGTTGGVVFVPAGNLVLNADIDVTGQGFTNTFGPSTVVTPTLTGGGSAPGRGHAPASGSPTASGAGGGGVGGGGGAGAAIPPDLPGLDGGGTGGGGDSNSGTAPGVDGGEGTPFPVFGESGGAGGGGGVTGGGGGGGGGGLGEGNSGGGGGGGVAGGGGGGGGVTPIVLHAERGGGGGGSGGVGNGADGRSGALNTVGSTTGGGNEGTAGGGGGSYGGGGGAAGMFSGGDDSVGGGGGGSWTGGGSGGQPGGAFGYYGPGGAGNDPVGTPIPSSRHYLSAANPRLMMGGADGLGSSQTGTTPSGPGGGIVVVDVVGSISGPGRIVAKGAAGQSPPGGGAHSGSGGGGGGQVRVSAGTLASQLSIAASGGAGGTPTSDFYHGGTSGGGGGGGGVWVELADIVSSQCGLPPLAPNLSVDFAGGDAGPTIINPKNGFNTATGGDGGSGLGCVSPLVPEVPSVDIEKGDTGAPGSPSSGDIVNDADTYDVAQAYAAGETREIAFDVTNDGEVDLYNVVVSDDVLGGETPIADLRCVFPGQASPGTAGVSAGTAWSVAWNETFGDASPSAIAWEPGASFPCTATLTLAGSDEPHMDRARVQTNLTAVGSPSDGPHDGPSDQDDYHAFTGDIQVIKYDGSRPDPAVGSGPTSWTPPAKPLADAAQDANTPDAAVLYTADVAQPVRWVVTNVGATWLADVALTDTTADGPAVGAWVCDLTPVAGPAGYSFVDAGPWAGPLAPGASFFCEGPLTLPAGTTHADAVAVEGTVVVPVLDDGEPVLDQDGVPTYATSGGDAVRSTIVIDDDDPFHARTASPVPETTTVPPASTVTPPTTDQGVTPPGPPASPEAPSIPDAELPRTGGNVQTISLLAAAVLLLGGSMLTVRRRRRPAMR